MAVTEAVSAGDGEQAEQTIENSKPGKYGIPKATLQRVITERHVSHNLVAEADLSDSLFEWKTQHYLDQEQTVPEDATGIWKDVETGRLIQVGKSARMGWYMTRDYETKEMDIIEPGRVIPAIENRRLIPVEGEN